MRELESWKGMLLSLVAYLAIPVYWNRSLSSSWGIYWFIVGWNPSDGWYNWIAVPLDLQSYLFNFIPLLFTIVLIALVLLAYKSKSPEYAAASLIVSVVLLLDLAYSHYYVYSYWSFADYFALPIDAILLIPLAIFSLQGQKTSRISGAPQEGLGKPTVAAVLSIVGGALLAIVGLVVVGSDFGGVGILGAHVMIFGSLIAFAGLRMYTHPSAARPWGIATVLLSILAGLNLIALIGGVLAIRWKTKSTTTTLPPSAKSIPPAAPIATKYCVGCGAPISTDSKYCASCGATQ